MFVDVMVKKQIPARLQIDDDDEPKNYRIRRDGDRDLSFKGWKIGSGEHGTGGTSGYEKDWNRGVEVKIYLTVSGRFVVKIYHWTCWQGESPSHQATVCSSLEAVYDYLIAQAVLDV